ncbi:Autophagy- protein 22 [Steccherinum ochraceum]|uniref:Autophagy-related protein n=1 Tax=Steccherinum ochraceum TaxID=92696 RepID=A0A4R0RTX6_9APHY|nr:Autophagy- protein 22 [Steccherinum ochraceum]
MVSESPFHDAKLYKRHLRGWLSYNFASEVFAIASLTLFMPICLEQFARDNGYLMPDRTEPCFLSTNETDGLSIAKATAPCVVKLGWVWVDTASFSLYVKSIGVALQALVVISMGGIADHPPHRKKILLICAYAGAIATLLFLILPSTSPFWLLCVPLAVLANIGFGASIVAMNAYLPTLAQESEEVVLAKSELDKHAESQPARSAVQDTDRTSDADEAEDPLLPRESANSDPDERLATLNATYNATLSRMTSRISSLGIALGYLSGISLLLLALIPVTKLGGSTFSLRLAISMSGIWWAIFTLPAAVWLPGVSSKASTPEWGDESTQRVRDGEEWSTGREILNAWKRLGGMLRWREMKKLKNTFQYLAAWFLLSDGFTTVISTAVLFGKIVLHMSPSALILVSILAPTSGILGSLIMPALQKRFAWSNIRVLVTLIVFASLIPVYGCIGFLPFFQHNLKFGGLTTQGEMYGLAVVFGFTYGAFSGYSRAFYADLIPPGEESRWYGLFSITDKTSSFVGPMVIGIIADLTGNIRYGFFFVVVMILAAIPILLVIDADRGRRDAREYVYRMTGLVADLSEGDNKSVILFDFHGKANQRWVAKQGCDNYWTLQNEANGTFLSVEGDVVDDAVLVGTKTGMKWVLQQDAMNPGYYRIIDPMTVLYVALSSKEEDPEPGTNLALEKYAIEPQQRWKFEEIL